MSINTTTTDREISLSDKEKFALTIFFHVNRLVLLVGRARFISPGQIDFVSARRKDQLSYEVTLSVRNHGLTI